MDSQLNEIPYIFVGLQRADEPQSVTEPQDTKIISSPPVVTSSQGVFRYLVYYRGIWYLASSM